MYREYDEFIAGTEIFDSPVNQRFSPIWGKNECVFQFPQNDNAETDLPRG